MKHFKVSVEIVFVLTSLCALRERRATCSINCGLATKAKLAIMLRHPIRFNTPSICTAHMVATYLNTFVRCVEQNESTFNEYFSVESPIFLNTSIRNNAEIANRSIKIAQFVFGITCNNNVCVIFRMISAMGFQDLKHSKRQSMQVYIL